MVSISGTHAAGAVDTNGADESPERRAAHGEGHGQDSESIEVATGETGATEVGGIEQAEEATADAHALVSMRRELDRVKGAASGLESALRESRSEVLQLRELLSTEENTTREQAGRISSLRYPVVASSREILW